MTLYEVQEYTLCDGWVNNWSYDDKPTTFDSYEAAQAELDAFLADCVDEARDGNMPDAPDYNDFRIVEVQQ